MKFLLELIQSQHPKQPTELISIISDARESGLRDEKATIHEFIDTLERITTELRSDPNAKAFLSRVKKAEAPDYYEIIKKPMDLGTVLKKVKSGAYKTKAAFNDDLELIWSNCLVYNSTMNPHLRTAAESLRTKSHNLLKYVSEPSENAGIGGSGFAKSATRISIRPGHSPKPLTPAHTGIVLAEKRWRRSDRGRASRSAAGLPEDDPPEESVTLETGQPQSAITISGTYETDVEVAWEDRPALIRMPDQMWNWFEKQQNDDVRDEEASDDPDGCSFQIVKPDVIMCGLPAVPFLTKSITKTNKKDQQKKTSREEKQGDWMRKSIENNIKTLWEIKKTHRKIADLNMNNPIKTDLGLESIPEELRLKSSTGGMGSDETDEDEDEILDPTPDKFLQALPSEVYETSMADLAGYQAMRQLVALLITHVGFDATQSSALNCLTEVAIQYLSNIGRSLHFFADRFSTVLSPSEMIYQTLRANGLGGLDELESYVKDDVEKYGSKLTDLLRKLQTGYGNSLAGAASKAFGDDDLFARDGEALVTGEFTNELGEDFFGLRELGLDSELGLSSLKIPSRLFYGQPKVDQTDSQTVKLQNEPEPEPRFVRPIPFVELESDWVSEQIGLLQPVYRARLESKEFGLKDDDKVSRLPKVFRPKVPPSGKIPIKRRALPPPPSAPNDQSTPNSNKKKRTEDLDESEKNDVQTQT